MSRINASLVYRSLVQSIQLSSTRPLRHTGRRRHNVLCATCNFSSSPVAYAGAYTRPTSKATSPSTTTTTPATTATASPTPVSSATGAASSAPTAEKPAAPVRSPPPQARSPTNGTHPPTRSLAEGLDDLPPPPPSTSASAPTSAQPLPPLPDADPTASPSAGQPVDWSRSFHGLSSVPFSKEASEALLAPVSPEDVEVKPDGIIYLPEIKYRRILNRAFGPGGWGLAPRGETIVTGKSVTREYGLVVHGRLVSIARGEQQYFDPEGIPTATEGCKSNALMRCCKDLGIASELWDPVFIRKFKAEHSKEVWVEQISTKKKRKIAMRKDVNTIPGGYKAT